MNTRWPVSAELNRDLRRLRVADFADHDLVGIVTQDRSQSTGKGKSFLLVDGNLRNAANLIFDRVFNGDDLVFVGLDFVDCCVERCRLSAPVGPVTNTMP